MKKLILNRNRSILGVLFGLLFIMSSCEKAIENPGFVIDVSVSVDSFSINGTDGEINHAEGEITFLVPYGTDITSVTPNVGLPEGATISPSVEVPTDFSNTVEYTVVNGNLFKEYNVRVDVMQPILKFSINGVTGSINNTNKTISVILPMETDITALQPEIELSTGVSINPTSGTTIDFSEPVNFTVSGGGISEDYTVTVSKPSAGLKVAYLGLAPTRSEIANPDEKVAADWLFTAFTNVDYISFEDIADGKALGEYGVIWWHFDTATDLPGIAFDANVVSALKAYRATGGNLLLTTFAAKYVDALGVVPPGKGPNNVFGDFLPNGFVDKDNSWGISFKGHESHPIFAGLETFEEGKANFLEKGTFRLNHTAWWFLPEWGGYGNGAGWREQTGGINLASEAWDDNLDGRVAIGEFPGNDAEGNVIVIAFGAYDWYNETSPSGDPSQPNSFLPNIERLTENSIKYLGEE